MDVLSQSQDAALASVETTRLTHIHKVHFFVVVHLMSYSAIYIVTYALQKDILCSMISVFNKGHCIGFQNHEILVSFITL